MRPYRLIPVLLLAVGLAAGASIAFGCGATDCEFTATCLGTTSGGIEAGEDVVQPPAGCDPKVDPKDSPKCVSNDYAVFVDSNAGNDTNLGTKEAPFKTIKTALEKANGKPRIYICEGTYDEHVKVTTPASLVGGFACGTWTYSGTRARVSPSTGGLALHVAEPPKAVDRPFITDLEFAAIAGSSPSESSVAAFVHGGDFIIRRVRFAAGAGVAGVAGTKGVTGVPQPAILDGMAPDASTNGGGPTKKCTCSPGGYSEGGKGGDALGDVDGKDGTIKPTNLEPPTADGKGGLQAECNAAIVAGHNGSNGAKGEPAASPPRGTLTASGWSPGNGSNGKDGAPGQGGGGGGGKSTNPGPGGGGGGACGGCQGTGGGGGGAGGSSIGLLVLDASIAVDASEFQVADAADGNDGATGGAGQDGGFGGSRPGGCPGGTGGTGGAGGAGAGGAGGISAGVLWKGLEPVVDEPTKAKITVGRAGLPGKGGIPNQNDGPPGIADKVVPL